MSTVIEKLVPLLISGDRLTREEFERRYDAMPDVRGAELIEGVVHMPSPVRYVQHGKPHSVLQWLFGVYTVQTPGVDFCGGTTVRLDDKNEPQPDVALLILPEFGGQVEIVDGYLEGAPELLAEVAGSTVSIDLFEKLTAYQRNGVREYFVWRTEDEAFDWFAQGGAGFQRMQLDRDGILRSRVFPGLWIDLAALLRDDKSTILASLHHGLASPEHAEFVAKLQANRRPAS
jgi:Uma2 family endonuclease